MANASTRRSSRGAKVHLRGRAGRVSPRRRHAEPRARRARRAPTRSGSRSARRDCRALAQARPTRRRAGRRAGADVPRSASRSSRGDSRRRGRGRARRADWLSTLGVHEGDFGLFDVASASLETRSHLVLSGDGETTDDRRRGEDPRPVDPERGAVRRAGRGPRARVGGARATSISTDARQRRRGRGRSRRDPDRRAAASTSTTGRAPGARELRDAAHRSAGDARLDAEGACPEASGACAWPAPS